MYKNNIYAAGGNYESTGAAPSKRVQKYDLESDTWTEMPPMLNGRYKANLITCSFPQHLV